MTPEHPDQYHEGRFSQGLSKLLQKLKVDEVPHIKRVIVTIIGGTVVIFGFIMIVTPGPAVLVIPAGLAILGTEYAWARRWLRKARAMTASAISKTQTMTGFGKSPKEEGDEELVSIEKACGGDPAGGERDEPSGRPGNRGEGGF